MGIPRDFLDELYSRLSITDVVSDYVSLKSRGGESLGLCPFHSEKTPSFSVNEEKQVFHCFGCGKGGGVIQFMMDIENVPYADAVHMLAAKVGLTVPEEDADHERWARKRNRILELTKEAARFYRSMLTDPRGAAVAEYISKERKISPKFSARFGLGAAPDEWSSLVLAMQAKGYDKSELLEAGLAVSGKNGGVYDKFRNRLMLPVINIRGEVIGFTSRVIDPSDAPKYLNTPETAVFKKASELYGLNLAKNTKRANFILVEGNIDVITLHQAGFDNTVATMGTSLTEEHVRILSKYTKELIVCYDNDRAGKDATQRALTRLRNSNLNVKVLQLPQRKTETGEMGKQDADDFIKNYGKDTFEALMNRSSNSVEYRLDAVKSKYNLEIDEQKAAFAQEASEIVASLESPVEREIYGNRVAESAGISGAVMAQEIERIRKKKFREAQRKEDRKNLVPTQQLQPKSRSLRYSNVRSAMAEEGILRIVLLDGDYFRQLENLKEEYFSSPVLAKAYHLLRERWEESRPIAFTAFDGEFTEEETNLLASLVQKPQARNTAEQALKDNMNIILTEYFMRRESNEENLTTLRDQYKQTKSYGG